MYNFYATQACNMNILLVICTSGALDGWSRCHMSHLRKPNVALSNLKNAHATLWNFHGLMHYYKKHLPSPQHGHVVF